jgi:tryptophan 2,3-dioxygenase
VQKNINLSQIKTLRHVFSQFQSVKNSNKVNAIDSTFLNLQFRTFLHKFVSFQEKLAKDIEMVFANENIQLKKMKKR